MLGQRGSDPSLWESTGIDRSWAAIGRRMRASRSEIRPPSLVGVASSADNAELVEELEAPVGDRKVA
jgi:hypothetical protein